MFVVYICCVVDVWVDLWLVDYCALGCGLIAISGYFVLLLFLGC